MAFHLFQATLVALLLVDVATADTATFDAQDTMLWKANPNTNYGNLQDITVDLSDGGQPTQALLKIPFALPTGAVVSAATLHIYTNNPTSGSVTAFRMIQSWSENSVTWNDFGSNGVTTNDSEARSSASFTVPNTNVDNNWVSIDVKSDVDYWITNGVSSNQGWLFTNSNGDGWDFDSGETSRKPSLTITFEIGGATQQEFSAVDTDIRSGSPNTSYGSSTSIVVDQSTGGGVAQGLIKFDLSGLPSGASVISATLEVFQFDPSSSGANVYGYRMFQTWSESSTWNSLGGGVSTNGSEAASTPSFSVPSPTINGLKSIDVTDDVVAWVTGSTNQGWVLISTSTNGWDMRSSESTQNPPKLKINFETTESPPTAPPPPPPPPPTTQQSPQPTPQPTFAPTPQLVPETTSQPVSPPTPSPPTPSPPTTNPTTTIFSNAQDTQLWQVNPNSNYGSLTDITVDQSDGGGVAQALIKFDLTSLSGATIESARLDIYSNNPSSGTISAFRMIQGWSEGSVDWNDFGSNGVSPNNVEARSSTSFTIVNPGSGTFISRDVTSDVSFWANGGSNQGWVLINSNGDGFDFDSTETSRGPELTVTYSGGSPTPPTPTPPTPTPPTPTPPVPTPPVPTPPVPTPPSGGACPNGPATYFPGDLTVTRTGISGKSVTLSTGLNGRALTRSGQTVNTNGGPTTSMHGSADGAAVVPDDSNSSRYYYVSNSESSSGGVGILHIDGSVTPHRVIGYQRAATSTSGNCGGGRTPWGTWLTSEESGSSGRVWEVDPNENGNFCRSAIIEKGANYESNAFWAATDGKWHFYTTIDSSSNYLLTRFIPNESRTQMLAKPRKLDRLCTASTSDSTADNQAGQMGQHTYLVLNCNSGCSTDTPSGTYSWSTNPGSSSFNYGNTEGIDVKGTELFFVSKTLRRVYIVDLVGNTWRAGATIQNDSGSEFTPDQVARITGSDSPDDILYFCEDGGGTQDIHARGRDANGDYRFFTIIRGYDGDETTGLTFSPDNKYMYFAHQPTSEIWQIWREDGCSFGDGNYIDIKYHQFEPFRMLRGGMPNIQIDNADDEIKAEAVFES